MLKCPDDYSVYYIDMPCTVPALVSTDDDGYPSIFINSRLSAFAQARALKHELDHIAHDDAFNRQPIRAVEHRTAI